MSSTLPRGSVCPKCGGVKTRVVGHSPAPPVSYVQCDACGHISVQPLQKPERP